MAAGVGHPQQEQEREKALSGPLEWRSRKDSHQRPGRPEGATDASWRPYKGRWQPGVTLAARTHRDDGKRGEMGRQEKARPEGASRRTATGLIRPGLDAQTLELPDALQRALDRPALPAVLLEGLHQTAGLGRQVV